MKLIFGGTPNRKYHQYEYWWFNNPDNDFYLIRKKINNKDYFIIYRKINTVHNEVIHTGPFPTLKAAELALHIITS